MRSYSQNQPTGTGSDADFFQRILRQLREELQFYDSESIGWRMMPRGILAYQKNPVFGGQAGGYMGEYDPLKPDGYTAGQTFSISTPLTITIASVHYVIAAGYWGVPPAATAVDAQGWGPFAGSLPANPTTAGINIPLMFFNPENITATVPIPPFSAAPNDKFYARLIFSSCGNA